MNANQLINMVTRMVMRRLINGGIDAGINAMSKSKSKKPDPGPWDGEQGATPKHQFDAKRARQAMRATRKIGRF
ncbi:MAG: hypothetical protein JJ868_16150 [Shimia sp.]|uniref:hypothetical protein n=1 Tax=Shimia sp. TaxID=1954381 RepID=UPI001B2F4A29|nr:hypothetical protein [Shimia sp.]MBO6898904.1 hypothetical protein [Shimia sp.]